MPPDKTLEFLGLSIMLFTAEAKWLGLAAGVATLAVSSMLLKHYFTTSPIAGSNICRVRCLPVRSRMSSNFVSQMTLLLFYRDMVPHSSTKYIGNAGITL